MSNKIMNDNDSNISDNGNITFIKLERDGVETQILLQKNKINEQIWRIKKSVLKTWAWDKTQRRNVNFIARTASISLFI